MVFVGTAGEAKTAEAACAAVVLPPYGVSLLDARHIFFKGNQLWVWATASAAAAVTAAAVAATAAAIAAAALAGRGITGRIQLPPVLFYRVA